MRSMTIRQLINVSSRAIPRLSFLAFGVWTALAVIYTPMAVPKDWGLYYDTASLILSGRLTDVYPGITPGYPFLYPPPFLWFVAWLGLLSPAAAHASLVMAMVGALVGALWMLHKGLDDQGRALDSWVFVVLSSAGWVWMLAAGHIAAWFVLLLSVGLLLWRRGNELAAGLALSFFIIKPHYCIPILLCAVLGRAWRVLGGAMMGLGLLALTTVPLGRGVWAGYLRQFGSLGGVMADIPPWKQITVVAFWRSVLGESRPMAVAVATVVLVAPCIVLVALAWVRCRPLGVAVPRLFALTALMLISCNVYSFHYDSLLLTIPGAVWYLRGHEYTSSRSHFATGVVILLAYIAQHASALIFQRGVAAMGLLVAMWLIIDARDLLRSRLRVLPKPVPVRDPGSVGATLAAMPPPG